MKVSQASLARRSVASLCAIALVGCGRFFYEVPETAVPSPVVERVHPKIIGTLPPLSHDKGRMVFDCVGARCMITEELEAENVNVVLAGEVASGESVKTRPVCGPTPCWADTTFGPHAYVATPTDVPSCLHDNQRRGFRYFKREGRCFTQTQSISVPATSRPTVLVVRPQIEHHVPSQNLREVMASKFAAFEVDEYQGK